MIKQNYEVDILVNGHPIKEYYKEGKTYVEAREGNKFSIKIKNNGYKRIVVIPTVDGLSVMDGKEGNYESQGYIISGYSSITIDGWRTSDKEVAEFFFTNPKGSYSKKMAKGNLGVIGVAIFREKEKEVIHHYHTQTVYVHGQCNANRQIIGGGTFNTLTSAGNYSSGNAGITTSSNLNVQATATGSNQVNCMSMTSQDIGAGFGESKRSEVTEVSFEKESSADAIFEIYYNTRRQLENLGIDFYNEPRYVTPKAFPGKYCERPN